MKTFRSTNYMLATLALASILLAGCASPYIVVLTNGQRYTTAHKPTLEQANGRYNFVFVDSTGRTNSIPSGYVRAVVPASQVKPAQ